MRLASWNVESIRAHLDQVVAWIEANDIDVACLQETRADDRSFPRSAFEDMGYAIATAGGQGGQAGVAVLTRSTTTTVGEVVRGIPGAVAPLDLRRTITLTVNGVRVHTAYAPNGRKVGSRPHELKLAWFALFSAWLEIDRDDHPDQLVLGDLNIAPDDLDVWEPNRYRKRNLTSPAERAAFDSLLNDGALIDVVRAHHGDERIFTWWNRRSDFYATDRGWRLDHALASPQVAERVQTIRVDRAERGRPGSADHAPLVLELATS